MIILLSCLTLGSIDPPIKHDMFLFEDPFLIGQWSIINPEPRNEHIDFQSISLSLESNYRFNISVKRKGHTRDSWAGEYSVENNQLIIGANSVHPQIFQYRVYPNQLVLNGVTLYKTMPPHLSGYWQSTEVRGADVMSGYISTIDLILNPDFYFSIQSTATNGLNKYREGVYYIEDNNIYFIFKDGEQASQFALKNNQLVLSSDDADMYIAFQRKH